MNNYDIEQNEPKSTPTFRKRAINFIINRKWFIISIAAIILLAFSVFFILNKDIKLNVDFINEFGDQTVEKGSNFKNSLDAFTYANIHFEGSEEFKLVTSGSIDAIVEKQSLNATTIKTKEGSITQMIVSTGTFKNIGVEVTGSSSDSKYRLRKTNSFKSGNPVFSNNWNSYDSDDDLKSLMGTTPQQLNYEVSKRTVIDQPYFSYKTNPENGQKEYFFVLELHRLLAVRGYRNYMKYISDLGTTPRFQQIFLLVTIDDLGRFKKIEIREKYVVTMLIQVTAVASILDEFTFYDDITIGGII